MENHRFEKSFRSMGFELLKFEEKEVRKIEEDSDIYV